MKKIVILGSTGSIGKSTLRVVEAHPSRFEVVGLAVRRDFRNLLDQAARFKVKHLAVEDPAAAAACATMAPRGTQVLAGESGLRDLVSSGEADVVVCAVVGMAGLKPVLAALRPGIVIALATKEVLVGAGRIVTAAFKEKGAKLFPVDSEHSAIFQCLDGKPPESVSRILLTASGGPFAQRPDLDFEKVGVDAVLDHPRWKMGKKVTVDSATMMNKGLEIMEAHWLFGVPLDQIDVVIHPESIVHSLVEFRDMSILAQMSVPDMRFPIQYALSYPERLDGGLPRLDLVRAGALHFLAPDVGRFPCLALARTAANTGGTMPAVLNAANEVAVQRFLSGQLRFAGIWRSVESVMQHHKVIGRPELDEVIAADKWARETAEKLGGGE